jgi:hypothetical protein
MSHAKVQRTPEESVILGRAMLLDLLKDARKTLEEDSTLQPILFIELSIGKGIICPLVMPDNSAGKYRMFQVIGNHVREQKGAIKAAVLLTETWIVMAKEAPDATKYMPSQHPCRQEAIVLVGRNADKTRSAIVIQTFTRDEHNSPVWSEPQVIISDSPQDLAAEGLLDALFDN